MKKFIKENWFKISVVAILLVIALSFYYHFAIFVPLQEKAKLGQQKKVMDDTQNIATKVINYTPPQDLPSEIKEGSCWTSSLAAPYRQDAWRCMVGNYIYDPCFNLPKDGYVLCDVNPETGSNGFQLKLTKLLPEPNIITDSTTDNMAWLVELQDGTFCSASTGEAPIANNLRANYDCNPDLNKEDLFLIGDLKSGLLWSAEKANLTLEGSDFIIKSSEDVLIKTVWR